MHILVVFVRLADFKRTWRIFGIVWLVLGLALAITSTVLDYWYLTTFMYSGPPVIPDPSYTLYFGLWEECKEPLFDGPTNCTSWANFEDAAGNHLVNASVYACQAMMILGMVLNAGAIILAIRAFIQNTTTKAVQGLAASAAVCYVVSAAVFGVKYHAGIPGVSTNGGLHVGFVLAVAAAGINFMSTTCMLLCVESRRHPYERIESTPRDAEDETIDEGCPAYS